MPSARCARRTALVVFWCLALAAGSCSEEAGPSREPAATRPAHRPGAVSREGAATLAASQPTTTATAPAMRRVHVFISGRVQGVGFRAFTRYQALALKLAGWVRNLPDGRVEAVVEGPPEKVAELLKAVGRGPSSARVDKIEATDEPHKKEFETFEVRL